MSKDMKGKPIYELVFKFCVILNEKNEMISRFRRDFY